MTGLNGASLALATMLLSLGLVFVVRATARRFSWLDVPVARSAHDAPTPTMGGLGIVGAMAIVATLSWVAGALPVPFGASLISAWLLVAAISLCDDIWNLPATPRLAAHVSGALLVVMSADVSSMVFLVVAALWVAGFINAFNFMDGSDGIAGVHALIAGLAWVALGVAHGEVAFVWAGLLVSSACGGFLVLNWHPASVFMGDVGATFLGVILASMPWLTDQPTRWIVPAMLATWPFWFDAGITLVDRIRRRELLGAGHQDHLYQRLLRAGWSHQRVAAFYGVLSAIGAVAALLAAGRQLPLGLAVAATGGGALVAIVRTVEKRSPATLPITAAGPGSPSTH